MAHEIIMPALGMAQETGRLVAWLKNEGDAAVSYTHLTLPTTMLV